MIQIIKKKYEVITVMALILASTGLSGYYLGILTPPSSAATPKTPMLDDRQSRTLSSLMDQVIGACYYDTYQLNESVTASSADACDKIMMFNKEICKTKHLEACDSEFLRKYLAGMGQ